MEDILLDRMIRKKIVHVDAAIFFFEKFEYG